MLAKLELRDRRALAAWRPAAGRRRLGGVLAVPAVVWSVGRPLAWVGAGVATLAGVVVVAVALVALEAIVEGDGNSPTTVGPPTARPTAAAAPVGETCSHSADPTCLVAVYAGAPEDYAEVADIPESALLEPDADGRYHVERGRQVTVITRAALPEGWTEFDLQLSPSETPLPASQQRLTSTPKTTYTFTVTADERGASLITYELRPARARPLRPGTAAVGDAVVATQFLVPLVRYRLLDTTGAASTPGSYAFLWTAGDATSSADVIYSASGAVELRIHPMDARGVSRAVLYDSVQIGDAFDFRTNGLDCGHRFRVTSVSVSASPRVFGIEPVRQYGGRCRGVVAGPVEFIWKVRPGLVGADGIRTLLDGEIVGQGTYRIDSESIYLIDVPTDARIFLSGLVTSDDPRSSGFALVIKEAATGLRLSIDPDTGVVLYRAPAPPDVATLLDQIIASIRPLD